MKHLKTTLFAFALLIGLAQFSTGNEQANLGWYAASKMTQNEMVRNGGAGAGGTAGAMAGAWAAGKIGAAVGTSIGPVGTAIGAIGGAFVGAM